MIVKSVNLKKNVLVTNTIQEEKEGIEFLTSKYIVAFINKYYNLECRDRSRKRNIVLPRQIACYLSRKHTKETLYSIAANFRMNHATVLYSQQAIENLIEFDKQFREQIKEIENKLILKTKREH